MTTLSAPACYAASEPIFCSSWGTMHALLAADVLVRCRCGGVGHLGPQCTAQECSKCVFVRSFVVCPAGSNLH